MNRLKGWWNGVWYASGSPFDLAAARIVVAVQALWILMSRDYAAHSGLPPAFWSVTPDVMRWRFMIFPGHEALEQGLATAALASLVMVLLGVWPRVSCLVAAVLLYHLAPYEVIYRLATPMERGLDVTILALVVLAAAPCADAWSVARGRTESPAWMYHWPVVLIQLYLAQVYLFAGYAKLFHVGPAWLAPETIRNLILNADQVASTVPIHPLALWIAASPLLCALVAWLTVAMDFGFIVAVFWKRSRQVILPAAVLFHVGILLCTTIYYLNWPLLLVFADWDAWRRRARTLVSRLSRASRENQRPATITPNGRSSALS